MPNQALPAVIGALVGMFPKRAGYFGFNSLSKQRSRAVAQNIGQSIGEGPWLNQSKNVSVGHGGVSWGCLTTSTAPAKE